MATITISLPNPMRDWVEVQIKTEQYANNSDYLRDLIRKDQRNTEKLKSLQAAITQGFASGKPVKLGMQAIKQNAKRKTTSCAYSLMKRQLKLAQSTYPLSRARSKQYLAVFFPRQG